jgi:hypothetical protein
MTTFYYLDKFSFYIKHFIQKLLFLQNLFNMLNLMMCCYVMYYMIRLSTYNLQPFKLKSKLLFIIIGTKDILVVYFMSGKWNVWRVCMHSIGEFKSNRQQKSCDSDLTTHALIGLYTTQQHITHSFIQLFLSLLLCFLIPTRSTSPHHHFFLLFQYCYSLIFQFSLFLFFTSFPFVKQHLATSFPHKWHSISPMTNKQHIF